MKSFYISVWKPVGGKLIALIILVISLPLLFIIASLLYLKNNREVLFIQMRTGKDGKIFRLIKFKTLLDTKDLNGAFLPDVQREFPIGRFLRQYHLDELPQLINIIQGDMNLIGPRPLLPEYLSYYSSLQNKRHLIKPGLMGLSQSKGANLLPWGQRLKYDTYYATHSSLMLDLIILKSSVKYFLAKKGKVDNNTLYSESFIDYVMRGRSAGLTM